MEFGILFLGKVFEKDFIKFCNFQDISIHKLPEFGAKKVRAGSIKQTRIICDFILGYKDYLFLIDTKSYRDDRISYNVTTAPTFAHQIQEMNKLQIGLTAHRTGFIVQFRGVGVITYFTAQQLMKLEPGSSLKYNDGLILSSHVEDPPNIKLIFNVD